MAQKRNPQGEEPGAFFPPPTERQRRRPRSQEQAELDELMRNPTGQRKVMIDLMHQYADRFGTQPSIGPVMSGETFVRQMRRALATGRADPELDRSWISKLPPDVVVD